MRELHPTKLHAFLSVHAPELEEKAKARELAGEAFREAHGKIEFHYEGSLIRVGALPGWQPYEREHNAKRGKIGGFSRKARTRMMELCAKIRSDAPALFVTLTYPRAWPGEASRWKRDLDAFGKWLRRIAPTSSAVWKLEPQERGAPHFHLLVWGVAFLAHDLIAQRWFEIVGSGDPNHRAAGTSIERVRSARGVRRYASKSYMGKELAMPQGWENVGRFWGVIGRQHLPLSSCETIVETKRTMIQVRRVLRRYLRSKGMRRGGKCSIRLYTEEHCNGCASSIGRTACPSPTFRTSWRSQPSEARRMFPPNLPIAFSLPPRAALEKFQADSDSQILKTMKATIELNGLYRDGWSLFVPTDLTCQFITFLRDKKIATTVEVGVISEGSFGQSALDLFTLDDDHSRQAVEQLIEQFEKSVL